MIHNVRGAGFILRRTITVAGSCARQANPGMHSMRRPQFIRSNTFRLGFAVAAVFASFRHLLFGFIYWKIDDYLMTRSDRVITAQLEVIAALSPERRRRRHRRASEAGCPRRAESPDCSMPDGKADCRQSRTVADRIRIDAPAQSVPIASDQSDGRTGRPRDPCGRAALANGDVLVVGTKCR